ncbi:MAG: Ku protein [bacterium]
MRSIWKGHIRFSLVTIPVRIYNAIDTQQTIRFNQLHKECNGPIGYDKRCKKCETVVKNEEIVKGYQYEPEQYVIVEQEDFEKLRLKSTKVIEIEGFVDASEVHPTLYDAPYFAGPDGEVAAKTYSLLCKTLKETGKLGIGKLVLRDRESVMLMAPHENGLLLYKLRYPEEVKNIGDVPMLDDVETDEEQLKLARTLVDSMSKSMSEIVLKDKYHDALREVIAAKVDGKEIITVEEEEAPVVDIMTALKQSIEQAKDERKPMKKATGKAKKAKPAAKQAVAGG